MDERAATIKWLVAEAQNPNSTWLNALYSRDIVMAKATKGVQKDQISLSEELAWDLATGAVTTWLEPGSPEIEALNRPEQANALRISVEVAALLGLRSAGWLALGTHHFCSTAVNTGLAESDLSWLLEKLRNSLSPPSPLGNLFETLKHLESMIDSVEESRYDCAILLAVSAVSDWAHYSYESPSTTVPVESNLSGTTAMADWVVGMTNRVLKGQSPSDTLKLLAYESACSSIRVDGSERLLTGRVSASAISSWFEDRMSEVVTFPITDSQVEYTPSVLSGLHSDTLRVRAAEWLVENRSPLAALSLLPATKKRMADTPRAILLDMESAIVRASAYASMGDIHRAVGAFKTCPARKDLGSPEDLWAFGRLWLEAGIKQGQQYSDTEEPEEDIGQSQETSLHRSESGSTELEPGQEEPDILWYVATLPSDVGFTMARVRMRLLLAEQKIEEAKPKEAIFLVYDLGQISDAWVHVHVRVIMAEAFLLLGRDDPGNRDEFLGNVSSILRGFNLDRIRDTPDRVRPRALAALGEVELLGGNVQEARQYLRKAMLELDKAAPLSWDDDDGAQFGYFSPDRSPNRYWRRPWRRDWTRATELSLIAELTGELDDDAAFAQLQRYRRICHSNALSELTSFDPEASLGVGQRQLLEELRISRGKLKAEIVALHNERLRVEEALTGATANNETLKFRQRSSAVSRQLEHQIDAYQEIEHKVTEIEKEIDNRRGYLAHMRNIVRPPGLRTVKERLGKENAAVVELVRVNGVRWDLETSWFAFVVTPEGEGIELIPIPEPSVDSDLRALRNDRFALNKPALAKLSEAILGHIPRRVFKRRKIFIAADGDACTIPFRSLLRPRWRFIPWSLALAVPYLAYRMDKKMVSNVISTNHLHRLLIRPKKDQESLGIVVGSSGGSEDRALCEGLARSLEVQQPPSENRIRWKRYPGSLDEATPQDSDRPAWMDGTSGVFMASWHTTFTGDSATVAKFHFDDGDITLADFLSYSRQQSQIAVILSCSVSLPAENGNRVFSRIGSAGFGIAEALQADAIVATTNEVTAEIAFVLGRFLSAELADGRDVHTALARAQRRLRRCKVADVKRMLEDLQGDVPEVEGWLEKIAGQDGNRKVFPRACETEPFYILGLPTAWWNSGAPEVTIC